MVTQELINYIRTQRKLGKNKHEIHASLTDAGWNKADIEEALHHIDHGSAVSTASVPIAVPPGTSG